MGDSVPAGSLSRENSGLAPWKVINATGGTWVRKRAFRSGQGTIPFDQYVPGSRVTPKRESGIAGREPRWPLPGHNVQ